MNRIALAIVLIGLMTLSAPAQSPSSQPALPAGPTKIQSPIEQPAAPSGSLPAGHPDISQNSTTPNAGGAAGSAMPAGVNLPAGHPDISQMTSAATSRPAANGELVIHAVQKTEGGPKIGAAPVVVELYLQNQLLNRIETKLDENGMATVDRIPVGLRPRPVVKVIHGGVEFQAAGEQMSPSAGSAHVDVAVYETTETAPALHVRMRHVMVERTAGGLQVMEMLAVDNPSDRAWIGAANADGKRATFAVSLPSAAGHIQTSGLGTESARLEGTKLSFTGAVVPGTTEYRMSYFLPAPDGKANITVESPALVKSLIVFLPDDGTTVKAEGIKLAGSTDMGTGKQRYYKATELAAGAAVSLAISGIIDPGTPVAAAADTSYIAQIIAGAGAALILVIGVAFLFIKGGPKKA